LSRRTIIALAASVILGIGFIGTISTDASAYRGGVYRGGVYRGGVYRGGVYRGVRPGVAVGIGAAAVGAAAVGAAAAGSYYAPGYYGAPAQVACPYGYYFYPPTTAAYPRHNGCNTGGDRKRGSKCTRVTACTLALSPYIV